MYRFIPARSLLLQQAQRTSFKAASALLSSSAPAELRFTRLPTTFSTNTILQPRFFSNHTVSSSLSALQTKEVFRGGVIYNEPLEGTKAEYTPVPFSSYSGINKDTMKAITKVFGFEHASIVQDKIISNLPSEQDFLIKAKTGTGKTIAFLIGAIETLVKYKKTASPHEKGLGILIVSPTRELAKQIAEEAKKLVSFHRFGVHLLVGGESSRDQLRSLRQETPDIVVATPGRLLDIWDKNERFANAAKHTQVLVFDEADMLLDLGFQREVSQIIEQCPKERQNFLVSATFSGKVRQVARQALDGKEFKELDCVDPNETNVVHRIKQSFVQLDWDMHYAAINHILRSHIEQTIDATANGAKIILFLPTTKATQVYHDALQSFLADKGTPVRSSGMPRKGNSYKNKFRDTTSKTEGATAIYCLHGKKSQEQRSKISDRFRKFDTSNNNSAILITTDVSARGVDYPGTTFVMQIGVPQNTEQYTHRVGRTGRAGKSGEGIILLSPLEKPFLRELKRDQRLDLAESEEFSPQVIEDLKKAMALAAPKSSEDDDSSPLSSYSASTAGEGSPANKDLVKEARNFASKFRFYKNSVDPMEIEDMFISLLGYYQSVEGMLRFNPQEFIDEASSCLEPFGITEQPPLPSRLREAFKLNKKRPSSRFGSSYGGSRGGFRGNDSFNRRDSGFGGGDNYNRRDSSFRGGDRSNHRESGSGSGSGYSRSGGGFEKRDGGFKKAYDYTARGSKSSQSFPRGNRRNNDY